MTPSVSSSSWIEAPSSLAPGMTSLAPTAGPAKATPQALAWYMGVTGRMVSVEEKPITSG